MHDEYRIDDHKLHFHPEKVSQWLRADNKWDAVKTLYPLYVEISPFGGCNFRCSFCAVDFLKYRPNKIEISVLKNTLTVMGHKGVKSILFAGEGEPLLYDELDQALAHCSEVGIDSAVVSNASISNQDILKSITINARWFKASVNAGNSQDHQQVHQCRENVFDKVFSNLEYCVSARRDFGGKCVLGSQAVLVDENQNSMVELARRSREIGLDYLVIKPYSQHSESITQKYSSIDYSYAKDLAALLAKEEKGHFKVHFRWNAFGTAESSARTYKKCYSTPIFWAYVRATGDVFGCSNFLLDSKFHYGNINEQDFDQIWEGEKRKANFEFMKSSHSLDSCRLNCRMNKINEYLWELKNPSSQVNFI